MQKKYYTLLLRVSRFEKRQFEKAKEELGLSARELIEHSSTPCECCKNATIIEYKKDGEDVKITRGFLNRHR